jgi:hypothetical protein
MVWGVWSRVLPFCQGLIVGVVAGLSLARLLDEVVKGLAVGLGERFEDQRGGGYGC